MIVQNLNKVENGTNFKFGTNFELEQILNENKFQIGTKFALKQI
jgi:hypothetical protein